MSGEYVAQSKQKKRGRERERFAFEEEKMAEGKDTNEATRDCTGTDTERIGERERVAVLTKDS